MNSVSVCLVSWIHNHRAVHSCAAWTAVCKAVIWEAARCREWLGKRGTRVADARVPDVGVRRRRVTVFVPHPLDGVTGLDGNGGRIKGGVLDVNLHCLGLGAASAIAHAASGGPGPIPPPASPPPRC